MRKTCLDTLHQLAKRDPRVLYLGSDPGAGTLDAMKAELPAQFFVEGIAEANIIGMAAGLAMEGYIPYVNTIATFLTRRCFEQIAIDLCLQNLPVRLIANGGGLVYAPLGPTHTAIEDIAIMRSLPGMTVVAVADADEMRRFMQQSLDWPGPIYIRLGKGGEPVVSRESDNFRIGPAILARQGGVNQKVLLVSTGVMTARAIKVADELDATVLHMPTLKPLDTVSLFQAAQDCALIVTIEEHVRNGGLGSAVLEAFSDRQQSMPRLLRLALPDAFIHHYGSQDSLLEKYQLQPDAILTAIRQVLM